MRFDETSERKRLAEKAASSEDIFERLSTIAFYHFTRDNLCLYRRILQMMLRTRSSHNNLLNSLLLLGLFHLSICT